MTHDQWRRIADYFTPSELIELLEIDTTELIGAVTDYDPRIIDDEVVAELEEIMGVNG